MALDDLRRLARCRDHRDVNFFPTSSQDAGPALAVCERCPATVACLASALSEGEQGIWGGTTESQRADMLAELERIAA